MGTIRKLLSGKYQARAMIDGEIVSKIFPDATSAHNWLDTIERTEFNAIATIKDSYLREVMIKNGVKRGGYEATFYKLDALARIINKPLEEITKYDVLAYKQRRVREVSDSAVRSELQLLSRVLRWARDEKRIITLEDSLTKNDDGRDIPLTKKAMEILEKGFVLGSNLISVYSFRRASRLAGVTDVCLHSLRHSAITRAAEKGLSTVQLMTYSGHKSIGMLTRYSHIKAEKLVDLLDS